MEHITERVLSGLLTTVTLTTLGLGIYCAAAGAQNYDLEVMTSTDASLFSIDQNLSINDAGTVAFAGIDSDGSKLFISDAPGTRQAISFFSANRLFSTASINNESPAQVATRERVSGSPPIYLVRKWAEDGSVSTIIGNSRSGKSCSGGANPGGICLNDLDCGCFDIPFPTCSPGTCRGGDFDSAISFLDLNDFGAVAFITLVDGSIDSAVFAGDAAPPTMIKTFPGHVQLRPQISNDGKIVIVDGTNRLQVLALDGSTTFEIGGPGSDYTVTNIEPGISPDGTAIAFIAQQGNGKGVFVVPDLQAQIAYPLVGAELSSCFSSFSDSDRVAVTSLYDPSTGVQRITVVFVGTIKPSTNPGAYEVDLFLKNTPVRIPVSISPPRAIARVGDAIDTGGPTITSIHLYDPLSRRQPSPPPTPSLQYGGEYPGDVALFAILSDGSSSIIRARPKLWLSETSPDVTLEGAVDYQTLLQYDQHWKSLPYDGGLPNTPDTIGKWGCRLTACAMQMNYYQKPNEPLVDPLLLNAALRDAKPSGFSGRLVMTGACSKYARDQLGLSLKEGSYPPKDICGPIPSSYLPEVCDQTVVDSLCRNEPVVLHMRTPKRCTDGSRKGQTCSTVLDCPGGTNCSSSGHFVVATGYAYNPSAMSFTSSPRAFTIADPGHPRSTTLDPAYSGGYSGMRLMYPAEAAGPQGVMNNLSTVPEAAGSGVSSVRVMPRHDQGTFAVQVTGEGSTADSGLSSVTTGLTLAGSANIEMLLTDPLGRQAGYDPQSQQVVADIPGSSYARDGWEAADDSGDEIPLSPMLYVNQPGDGAYALQLSALEAGQFSVDILSFDQAGGASSARLSGSIENGVPLAFQISYSAAGTPVVVTTPTPPPTSPTSTPTATGTGTGTENPTQTPTVPAATPTSTTTTATATSSLTATATQTPTVPAPTRTSTMTNTATSTATATATMGAGRCVGDCRGSGMVNISDLITGVDIALGSLPVSACPEFANSQGVVDIAQLIKGVSNALNGCGANAA